MSADNLIGLEEIENDEPQTVDGWVVGAVQDCTSGESASFAADEFFDEFVNQNRPETQQILMFLDMPNETIVQGLIEIQMQGIEALRQNAPNYLNQLRNEVKSRLAGMAKVGN